MKDVIRFSLVIFVAMFAAACARNEAAPAPAAPPAVQVSKVVSKRITEFDEFTGRFEAVERVEVRPRVSGYVTATQFEQGHEVKKGDILYVIDARPYQAELKHAQAELVRARTQLSLAKSEGERATRLIEKHAISQEEFDARTSGNEQAAATLTAAEAAVDAAAAGPVLHAGACAYLGTGGSRGDHRRQPGQRRSDTADNGGVHRSYLRVLRR